MTDDETENDGTVPGFNDSLMAMVVGLAVVAIAIVLAVTVANIGFALSDMVFATDPTTPLAEWWHTAAYSPAEVFWTLFGIGFGLLTAYVAGFLLVMRPRP